MTTLCSKCCENVKKFDGEQWSWICNVTNNCIRDIDIDWSEGEDPKTVCKTYRGPIGFNFNEWNKKFKKALIKELNLAIDEDRIRQSEVINAFCKG